MLSEAQQKRVWEGMLGAEIRANYFADLSSRLTLRQKRVAMWTLILSSSAVGTYVVGSKVIPTDIIVWLQPALALFTAALSAYSYTAQNQKSAIEAADLHARWHKLARDFTALWDDMYDPDALDTLQKLEERAAEASKSANSFSNDAKAMLRWEEHVLAHRGLQLTI
jgi:hypothetical protein